jgi:serine/threonine kinase 3
MADPEAIYDVREELGVGTYGRVFHGKVRTTGEDVAVKIIEIEESVQPLKREVDIMKECKNEFVVRYLGSYEKESALWIAMELCEPGSIADVMRMLKTTLTENQIRVICGSVLLGLVYLHGRKYIHRDIKAGNILLSKDGIAKIADFGVSAQLSTIHSMRDTAIGAPFWMAPEVIKEEQYNGKADVWSLDISVIEMAEGMPPHHEIHPMRAIFMIPNKEAPTFKTPNKWSPEMVDFLSKCLVKDPLGRPSAEDLLKHPFVKTEVDALKASGGRSPILMELVTACLPLMEDYRSGQRSVHGDDTLVQGTLMASMSQASVGEEAA